MKIIVKKVNQEKAGSGRLKFRNAAAVIGAAALALFAIRGAAVSTPVSVNVSGVKFFVSESDKLPLEQAMTFVAPLPQTGPNSGGNGFLLNARDSVTVDDELDDLLLDAEEIDSGISSSYNGKLDVPSNVRLDRLDFGSDFVMPLKKARITSRFDYRVNPVTGRYVFHTGMDLGAASGSDIMEIGRAHV